MLRKSTSSGTFVGDSGEHPPGLVISPCESCECEYAARVTGSRARGNCVAAGLWRAVASSGESRLVPFSESPASIAWVFCIYDWWTMISAGPFWRGQRTWHAVQQQSRSPSISALLARPSCSPTGNSWHHSLAWNRKPVLRKNSRNPALIGADHAVDELMNCCLCTRSTAVGVDATARARPQSISYLSAVNLAGGAL